MAVQFKLTAKRGATKGQDLEFAAGDAEAQSDTISLNFDVTYMSKGEAILQVQKMMDFLQATSWPPL